MKKSTLALAILGMTSMSALAQSVDLSVTGTIIPSACTPTLGNSGAVDYGTIRGSALSATEYTALTTKEIAFSVSCTAPTMVAITAINNRKGSLGGFNGGLQSAGNSPTQLFSEETVVVVGLGSSGSSKIGGYALRVKPSSFTADTHTVDNIQRDTSDSDNVWSATGGGNLYTTSGASRRISWAATGQTTPVALERLSGMLEIQAYINKTEDLDLTSDIKLDGQSTIELVYL